MDSFIERLNILLEAESFEQPLSYMGKISDIDPSLRKPPEPGRTLDDLKKAWLPVVEVPVAPKPREEKPGLAPDAAKQEPEEVKEFKLNMSPEERRALKQQLFNSGYDQALDEWTVEEVIRALMGSILTIARHYATNRFPMEDAVAQAMLGVYDAIKRDEGKSPFAHYAWKQIVARVRRGTAESDPIKVPEGQWRISQREAEDYIAKQEREQGSPLSDEEKFRIRQQMKRGGLFSRTQFLGREVGTGEEGRVTTAAQLVPASARERPVLSPKIGGPEYHQRREFQVTSGVGEDEKQVKKMLQHTELVQRVFDMAGLNKEEEQVVRLLYGLDDGIQRQVKEVAAILGKRPQKVSEMKQEIMAKLVQAAGQLEAFGDVPMGTRRLNKAEQDKLAAQRQALAAGGPLRAHGKKIGTPPPMTLKRPDQDWPFEEKTLMKQIILEMVQGLAIEEVDPGAARRRVQAIRSWAYRNAIQNPDALAQYKREQAIFNTERAISAQEKSKDALNQAQSLGRSVGQIPAAARERPVGEPISGHKERSFTTTSSGDEPSQEKMLQHKEMVQSVIEMAELGPEEEKIARLLWGLDDGVERQVKEVAAILGMRPQRASEMKGEIMAKLTRAAGQLEAFGEIPTGMRRRTKPDYQSWTLEDKVLMKQIILEMVQKLAVIEE